MDENGLGILLQHVVGLFSIWRMSSYIEDHLVLVDLSRKWILNTLLIEWSNKQQY